MSLKDKVTWDASVMCSYPLEDYKKIKFPGRVVVRRQIDGLFFDLGEFKKPTDLKDFFDDNGIIVGPDQCDRVCYYR